MADVDLTIKAELDSDFSAQLQSQIQVAISAVESTSFKINLEFNTESIQQATNQLQEAMNSLNQAGNVSSSADPFAGMETSAENAAAAIKDATEAQEENASAAKDMSQAADDIASAQERTATATDEATQALIQQNTQIKQVENLSRSIGRSLQNWTAAQNSSNSAVREAYTGLEQAKQATDSLREELDGGAMSADKFKSQFSSIQAEVSEYNRVISDGGAATKSFMDRISSVGQTVMTWFSLRRSIMYAVQAMKEMVSAAVEVDSAMAQLKIVTDETDESYAEFGDSIAQTAQDIGASITDLLDSSTTYARLGYSMDESAMLAEYTSMLKNVGDIEVGDAQEAITSIVKAFDIDVDDIESVMDRLVAVGNNFPISVSEIAEGMTNASSALAAAGSTFDESVALLTAANTTIQNVSRSSTGLRTIVARLRNTTTELNELGEEMTTAQYEEMISALTDANVKLTEDGEFRDVYNIIEDIAHAWDDLSSMQQSAIAKTVAGTRQQAVFYSLIEQFQEAEGAMETMADSEGTLMESYDVVLDTTQRHIDTFKAATQGLSSDLFSSDFLNFFVDIGTGIVNVIDKIVDLVNKVGGLKTVIIGLGAAFTALKFDSFTRGFESMISGMQRFIGQFQVMSSSLKALSVMGEISLLPVASIAAATAGLIAFVAVQERVEHSYTRAHDKAEESAQAYEDEASELESLQAQLDSVSERREELETAERAGTITLDEEAELQSLQQQTEELERQVALKQQLADEAERVSAADAYDAAMSQKSYLEGLEDDYGKFWGWMASWATDYAYSESQGLVFDNPRYEWNKKEDTSDLGLLKEQVEEVKSNYDDLRDLREKISNDPTNEELWQQEEDLESKIAEGYDNIDAYATLVQAQVDALTDDSGSILDYASRAEDYVTEANKVLDEIATLDMEPAEKQQYEIESFFDSIDEEGTLTGVFEDAVAEGADLQELLDSLGISLSDIGDDIDLDALTKYFRTTSDSAELMAQTVEDAFDTMVDGVSDKAKDWYDSLSQEDRDLVYNMVLETDVSDMSFTELQEAFDEYKDNAKMSFTVDIEAETTSLDNLNSAMSESASATGLTTEAIANLEERYQSLDSYDPSKLFENTTEGIHLNKEALEELEEEYNKDITSGLQDRLDTQLEKYQEANEKLAGLKEGTADYYSALAEVSGYEEQIAATERLIAQYDGLTSAYQRWQDALSSTNENAGFESVGSSYDSMQAILDQGWYGNDDLQAYIDLLVAADQQTGDVVADFEKLTTTIDGTNHSLMDYFTYDEDNNLVTDGLFDFIDDVSAIFGEEYAGFSEDTGYYLDLTGDKLDEVAERFGTTTEFIQLMEKAMSEAGMDVHLGDSATEEFEELASAAEDAASTVEDLASEELGLDLDLNLESGDLEEVKSQIEDVQSVYDTFVNEDGTVNVDAEGYEETASVLTNLLMQKQELEQSGNILLNLDASSCDEGISEVVSLIQGFQEQYNNLEIETALHADTSDAEEKIRSIAEELDALSDEDIKAALNLDDEGLASFRATLDEIKGDDWSIDSTVNLDDSAVGDLEDTILEFDATLNFDDSDAEDIDTSEQTIDVTVNVVDDELSAVSDEIAGMDDDVDVTVNINTADIDSAASRIGELSQEVNVDISVNTGQLAIASVEIGQLGGDVDVDINVNSSQAVSAAAAVERTVTSINDKEVRITGNNSDAISKIQAVIAMNIPDKSFTISAIDNASSTLSSIKSQLDGIQSKTVTVTTNYTSTGTPPSSGSGSASGTANAGGTADSGGDWSVGRVERALVGELGREIVVRDGRYFTVGDYGAEFVDLRPDDIVFNHFQTEELLHSGRVPGRGIVVGDNSYAQGSAFDTATGGRRRVSSGSSSSGSGSSSSSSSKSSSSKSTTKTTTSTTTTTKSSGNSSSSSSKSSSNSSTSSSSSTTKSTSTSETEADDFEETLDWIEIKIDRIERAIDSLDLTMSSTYKTWSTRNSALTDELSKVSEEITIQQQAYDRYMQQANSVGLSSEYQELVKNGAIDITTITDEDLKDQIDDFQKWYEKALDCQEAVAELQESLGKLYRTQFDYVKNDYESISDVFEFNIDMLDEAISRVEEQGYIVSTKYYDALHDEEIAITSSLENEQYALLTSLNKAISSGAIEVYSEEWYDMCSEIDSVTLALEQGRTALVEYENEIRQIEWDVFDLILDRIGQINSEAEFLIDLMSNGNLYEDNGQLTGTGMATMGLRAVNFDTYMAEADKYAAEVLALDKEIAKDPYNQDLIDRREDLLELQQESILAAEDEKDAIKDLVEEGINKELDSLKELIDTYEDALDAQKDLYDYQKKVADQTSEIASLEKQLSAYTNDYSEETKAQVQKIKKLVRYEMKAS